MNVWEALLKTVVFKSQSLQKCFSFYYSVFKIRVLMLYMVKNLPLTPRNCAADNISRMLSLLKSR